MSRIAAQEVVERMKELVGVLDRSPFADHLALWLSNSPSATKIKKMDPEAWTRSVAQLAKLTGYTERSESVSVQFNFDVMLKDTLNTLGPAKTLTLLKAVGVAEPEALIEQAAEGVGDTPSGRGTEA